LRHFGTLSFLLNATARTEQLPVIARIMASLAEFMNLVLKLAGEREISPNQNRELGRAHMEVLLAVQNLTTAATGASLLPQMIADLAAARELLARRVPDRTRPIGLIGTAGA
jgi:hypothetical protein